VYIQPVGHQFAICVSFQKDFSAHFGSTYTKIGMIQRRLKKRILNELYSNMECNRDAKHGRKSKRQTELYSVDQ
jgi:hypothetical protein